MMKPKKKAHAKKPAKKKLDSHADVFERLRVLFKKTENPMWAFNALIISHRERLRTPGWAMDYIAEKFNELDKPENKGSLDITFKFKKHGQKEIDAPLYKVEIEVRDWRLAQAMLERKISKRYKNLDDAAADVYEEYTKGCREAGENISIPTPGTILKIYYQRKPYNNPEAVQMARWHLENKK